MDPYAALLAAARLVLRQHGPATVVGEDGVLVTVGSAAVPPPAVAPPPAAVTPAAPLPPFGPTALAALQALAVGQLSQVEIARATGHLYRTGDVHPELKGLLKDLAARGYLEHSRDGYRLTADGRADLAGRGLLAG